MDVDGQVICTRAENAGFPGRIRGVPKNRGNRDAWVTVGPTTAGVMKPVSPAIPSSSKCPELAFMSAMTDRHTADYDLNLASHRQQSSVWEKRGWDGSRQFMMSRWLLGIGGAVLAIESIRRRKLTLAGLGGTLVWWALTGEGDLADARQWFDQVMQRAPWRRREDPVQLASDESFPASDAPAWTPTVGTGIRRRVPTH